MEDTACTYLNETVKDLSRNNGRVLESAIARTGVVGGGGEGVDRSWCKGGGGRAEDGGHESNQGEERLGEHVCGRGNVHLDMFLVGRVAIIRKRYEGEIVRLSIDCS